ncbi:hypothetical protein [Salinimicrobium sp. TH3]|uniref:hypothetical protein n=1 Tax=Salinimicrobium sp. TH3 TaxID=2997342 RepID=UPI002274042F|nr:hypothetical protein [Salinimicrobium sp. TH3]MCY2686775.1 hypothetical protein [Salinimicrobium sp. TH3]
MTEKLLPNYSKKIALTIGLISIFTLILIFSLGSNIKEIDPTILEWIFKNIFLVSLLVLVFSKEKKESLKINNIRLQQTRDALGFGVVVIVLDSLSEIIFWDGDFEMKSGFTIMVMVLLYYLIFFTYKKYNYNKTIL